MRQLASHEGALLFAVVVFPLSISAAEPVDAGALGKMVNGKKWEMKWAACMGAPPCRAYWDWKADGSVCARAIDAKRDERCADEGRWRLKGDSLCWELQWFGSDSGAKSACVRVEPSGPGQYTAIRVGGFGTPFFTFTLAGEPYVKPASDPRKK